MQARTYKVARGTYSHRVLQSDIKQSCGIDIDELSHVAASGAGWAEAGWVGVTFSHLMMRKEVDFLIRAVMDIGHEGWKLLPQYTLNCATGASPCSTKCTNRTLARRSKARLSNPVVSQFTRAAAYAAQAVDRIEVPCLHPRLSLLCSQPLLCSGIDLL
jgi:hypothetical protein